MNFKAWEKGNMQRVYVNGAACQGAFDKVWIERQTPDAFGQDWVVKTKLAAPTHMNRGLEDEIYDHFGNTAECAAISFDQILKGDVK